MCPVSFRARRPPTSRCTPKLPEFADLNTRIPGNPGGSANLPKVRPFVFGKGDPAYCCLLLKSAVSVDFYISVSRASYSHLRRVGIANFLFTFRLPGEFPYRGYLCARVGGDGIWSWVGNWSTMICVATNESCEARVYRLVPNIAFFMGPFE